MDFVTPFYPDLSPCGVLGRRAARHLIAIGWLSAGEEYPSGDVDPAVHARLRELTEEEWEPLDNGESYACGLCRYEPEVTSDLLLFVPSGAALFVCNGLIAHAMNAHGYAPPRRFCEAVVRCPPLRSRAYSQAFLLSGGRELMRELGRSEALR